MNKEEVIKLIQEYSNPYPKDIFTWDNPNNMKITRGRFNEFTHLIVENIKHDLITLIKEARK